jgi:hypothetical protein
MSNYAPPRRRDTLLIPGLISGVIVFCILGCVLLLAGAELWAEQISAPPPDTEEVIDAPPVEETLPPVTDTPTLTATPTATATATATPTSTATATPTPAATATPAGSE